MKSIEDIVINCVGFDWDEGNEEKNWEKHQVKKTEAEQVFFNSPLVCSEAGSVVNEQRFLVLGKTNSGRHLTIIFTIRKGKSIRVISARDMSRKERSIYGEEK